MEGVTPRLFYLSDLVCPLFFVNLHTQVFVSFGCHPLEGVTWGGPPSPPPSDATDFLAFQWGRFTPSPDGCIIKIQHKTHQHR